MLFLHEVHQVVGTKEDEFEAAYRDGWMPRLAGGDDARLLWYLNHAHGSGVSYNVVTITAVRDGAAYERLVHRVQHGDLQEWARETDTCRHDVVGKLMMPVYWSRIQEVDFADVPTDGSEHELSLFMEDTGWPACPIDDYIKMWDELYSQPIARHAEGTGTVTIDIQACFQNAPGAGKRREAMLWQKVNNPETVLHLLTHDLDPEMRKPGTYMYESLAYRDQWESKLLRTSKWSPRF